VNWTRPIPDQSNELLQFVRARNFLTNQEIIDWWRHSGLNCWDGVCLSGELVSLVVGSSVVKTWKWFSLWNHIHRPGDNERLRRLPWQPVRSDCKRTTSILVHTICGYAAVPESCVLYTDQMMIPASNGTDAHAQHFHGAWQLLLPHPENIGTVHSLKTRYSKSLMFLSPCVAAEQFDATTNKSRSSAPIASSHPHRARHAHSPVGIISWSVVCTVQSSSVTAQYLNVRMKTDIRAQFNWYDVSCSFQPESPNFSCAYELKITKTNYTEHSHPWEVNRLPANQQFPSFYENQWFITVFAEAR